MGVGSGDLENDKKYVVLLEFYGPAKLQHTLRLKSALDHLLKRYKGKIKENVSADKRGFDPTRGWVKGISIDPAAPAVPPKPARRSRKARRSRRGR